MLNQRGMLPAGWAVRPACAADAPALSHLCEAHAAFEGIPHTSQGHAARLAAALSAGRLHIWLCLLDEAAVGYASATQDYSTLAAAPFFHLDCLYLEPIARGQGLGGDLLAAVLAQAHSLGCAQLQWQTPVWNADAMRFYDRLGAVRLTKQRYTLAL